MAFQPVDHLTALGGSQPYCPREFGSTSFHTRTVLPASLLAVPTSLQESGLLGAEALARQLNGRRINWPHPKLGSSSTGSQTLGAPRPRSLSVSVVPTYANTQSAGTSESFQNAYEYPQRNQGEILVSLESSLDFFCFYSNAIGNSDKNWCLLNSCGVFCFRS